MKFPGLMMLAFCALGAAAYSAETQPANPATPLENMGLDLLWEENFTNAQFDAMVYDPAFGSVDTFKSYLLPGAFRFGQADAHGMTEQQINYYRDRRNGEPIAQTFECFVAAGLQPTLEDWGDARHRLFLRPRRHSDGGHLHIAQPDTPAMIRGPRIVMREIDGEMKRDRDEKEFSFDVEAGEWVHLMLSEKIDFDAETIVVNFALNGEVLTFEGKNFTPRNVGSEAWCIEWNSSVGPDDWWYMRQLRGYKQYLDADALRKVSKESIQKALAAQPSVESLDAMPAGELLGLEGVNDHLNITEPPEGGIPEGVVTLQGDDLTFGHNPAGEEKDPAPIKGSVYIMESQDPFDRNLLVEFPPMRILKVEYDTRGVGEAEGWRQTQFKIGAGLSGWLSNLAWRPIAEKKNLEESGVHTFYPNVRAKGLKIDRTDTVDAEGNPIDKWFVNLEGIKITGIPLE